MLKIKIGDKFKSTTKLGNINTYEVAGKNREKFLLKATDETLYRAQTELDDLKKKNKYYENIQKLTIDDVSVMEVEPEWFNQRKIVLC